MTLGPYFNVISLPFSLHPYLWIWVDGSTPYWLLVLFRLRRLFPPSCWTFHALWWIHFIGGSELLDIGPLAVAALLSQAPCASPVFYGRSLHLTFYFHINLHNNPNGA